MKSLIGNGQPGRVDLLDRRVGPLESIPIRVTGLEKITAELQKKIWIGMGVLVALQLLHANGLLNLAHLFGK